MLEMKCCIDTAFSAFYHTQLIIKHTLKGILKPFPS